MQSTKTNITERIRFEIHQQWSDGGWRVQRPTYPTQAEAEERLRKCLSPVIVPGLCSIGKGESRPAFRLVKAVAQLETIKEVPAGVY